MEDPEPASEAVRRILQAAYEAAGKHSTLGRVVSAGTGRPYRNPERSSVSWVDGSVMPPADVLIAISRAFPAISLDEFARAAAQANSVEGLQREVRLLRRQLAQLTDLLIEIGTRVQLDVSERLAEAARLEHGAAAEDQGATEKPV